MIARNETQARRIDVFFYGLFMDEEASVSVYRPEAISVRLGDGTVIPALCFNLPVAPATDERNPQYAAKLRALAERIGLPPSYVSSIQ